MPQNENLSEVWKNELGENWQEVHTHYLHTLGNLTLTGYNPELSDHPFMKKRDMEGGFAGSPLRLNRDLAKIEYWNEGEIKKRAASLADQMIGIWKFPELESDILEKYQEARKQKTIKIYTFADHPQLSGPMGELFEHLRKRILNLDASVTEEILKLYIAYKTTTNFVDIVPQMKCLRLSLNMSYEEVDDPKGLCKDVSMVGRWGNGDVEIKLSSIQELDDIMVLILQSFDKQMD